MTENLADPQSRRPMEGVGLVLVDDGSAGHGVPEFRKGLEGVEQQRDEHETALAESAGGCLSQVEVQRAEHDGDDDAAEPGEEQRCPVLHFQHKLTLHKGPDLLLEAH